MNVLAGGLMIMLALLAALITTGGAPRRQLGMALGLATQLPPWLAAPEIARGALGLCGLVLLMRAIDNYRHEIEGGAWGRVKHAFSAVDARLLALAPHSFDWRGALALAIWVALMVGSLWTASEAPRLASGNGFWALRWFFGAVAAYAGVEALWTCARVLYRALGRAPPRLHTHPILARSVQELWGKRWSTPVNTFISANIFKPLVRRDLPRAGLVIGFFFSALAHAYVTVVAVGLFWGAVMGVFFLLQGGLVLMERRLRIGAWPAAAAHTWVVVTMLGTSPLFTEPMLKAFGL